MGNDLRVAPGELVKYKSETATVDKILGFKRVLLKLCDGDVVPAEINELSAPTLAVSESNEQELDLLDIDDDEWKEAQSRFELIKPMKDFTTRDEVNAWAIECGINTATLYRWKQRFDQSGRISSLVPHRKSGGRGKGRLNDHLELIINSAIEDIYLTKQKLKPKDVIIEVRKRCRIAVIDPPHPNTIRNRVSLLSERTVAKRRGNKAKERSLVPIIGKFPHAKYPLSVIQIDHTKLDIILVDSVHRSPIGRPWVTMGIDVFSRMITGFCISLDPPGSLSTGLCLSHSILPKDKWLIERDIKGEWPVWGIPSAIHLDNAKEFRGSMLRRSCEEYGITIEWRPVARPNFGGHIERLLGTVAKELHSLPGTTFSNTKAKGTYYSEKEAVMTLQELEQWMSVFVVQLYHNKVHSSLGVSPLKKYEEGIFGTDTLLGRGLPEIPLNERKLKLDFLPYVERGVQSYGVVIDKIHYYSDILRPWICSKDGVGSRKKRKFVFKRDPRDISKIYFLDPESHDYFEIPYRDISHPSISLWELREAQKKLEDEGVKDIDESRLFEAREKLYQITKESILKSKKARRSIERRSTPEDAPILSNPTVPFEESIEVAVSQQSEDEGIEAFDDVEF